MPQPTSSQATTLLQTARAAYRRFGHQASVEAWQRVKTYGNELRARLPVPTELAHAYNPHEHATSNGGTHILLGAPLALGRFNRDAGDALCKPARTFWGLTTGVGSAGPTCQRCIEIAERLTAGPR